MTHKVSARAWRRHRVLWSIPVFVQWWCLKINCHYDVTANLTSDVVVYTTWIQVADSVIRPSDNLPWKWWDVLIPRNSNLWQYVQIASDPGGAARNTSPRIQGRGRLSPPLVVYLKNDPSLQRDRKRLCWTHGRSFKKTLPELEWSCLWGEFKTISLYPVICFTNMSCGILAELLIIGIVEATRTDELYLCSRISTVSVKLLPITSTEITQL